MKIFSGCQRVITGLTLLSGMAFGLLAPVSTARAHDANNAGTSSQSASIQFAQDVEDDDPIFSKVYAHVNTTDSKVPVYATPDDAVNNANSVRDLNGYE